MKSSTAPAAISRRQRGKVPPSGVRLDGGVKDEIFDSLCSNRSNVVQLQVAPRGLRTAKVVKDESEASTAPAAIGHKPQNSPAF